MSQKHLVSEEAWRRIRAFSPKDLCAMAECVRDRKLRTLLLEYAAHKWRKRKKRKS